MVFTLGQFTSLVSLPMHWISVYNVDPFPIPNVAFTKATAPAKKTLHLNYITYLNGCLDIKYTISMTASNIRVIISDYDITSWYLDVDKTENFSLNSAN